MGKVTGGKYVYTYKRLYIPVPRVLHKKFRSILKLHIKMEFEEQKGRIGVFLTPVKNVVARRITPRQNIPKKAFGTRFYT